jgi:hypothetical protein
VWFQSEKYRKNKDTDNISVLYSKLYYTQRIPQGRALVDKEVD